MGVEVPPPSPVSPRPAEPRVRVSFAESLKAQRSLSTSASNAETSVQPWRPPNGASADAPLAIWAKEASKPSAIA